MIYFVIFILEIYCEKDLILHCVNFTVQADHFQIISYYVKSISVTQY